MSPCILSTSSRKKSRSIPCKQQYHSSYMISHYEKKFTATTCSSHHCQVSKSRRSTTARSVRADGHSEIGQPRSDTRGLAGRRLTAQTSIAEMFDGWIQVDLSVKVTDELRLGQHRSEKLFERYRPFKVNSRIVQRSVMVGLSLDRRRFPVFVRFRPINGLCHFK